MYGWKIQQDAYDQMVEATGKKRITIRRWFFKNKKDPCNEEDKINYIRGVQLGTLVPWNPAWKKTKNPNA